MFHMDCQDVEELWDKVNPIEKLSRPVEAPLQEINENRHSVRLQHVIPILS